MPSDPAKPGLRERKKAQTRATISACALRLFDEQGYEATTIEQIIEAAAVSESTFYRYFPTKEDLVLQDEYDPRIIAALRAQPADLPPITALRRAFAAVFGDLSDAARTELRERTALILTVPALRATMLDQLLQTMQALAVPLAERAGRDSDDFAVRTVAGAIVGALTAVLAELADDPQADVAELVERIVEQLESGLSL
ncbi:acyl-CoA-like ligand-binding transcription factor [Nocardia aurantia]|uniref:Putative mycofactocin biosynthesis transcriptional regulator MftR n=1 Tax=Nocardia aurantia TaxID=2585199 RepID=A0A7K0DXU1_9NOCA|nr:TetR family transcriptional regulator [Nocardia aurantia]MQY30610.1 putative mycofactocin biosynthesis transcriptional regulator MftR [Nocardia aurantia]